MNLSRAILVLVLCAALLAPAAALASEEAGPVLDTAEGFFKALKAQDYRAAWGLLTRKSRDTIINDVYQASKKRKEGLAREEIERDFATGGPVFNAYWKGFTDNFDPDLALRKSTWRMGKIKRTEAEVVLQIKEPARLKLYKEDGAWRFGLVESFWTRK